MFLCEISFIIISICRKLICVRQIHHHKQNDT